jgi:hypothetical protein
VSEHLKAEAGGEASLSNRSYLYGGGSMTKVVRKTRLPVVDPAGITKPLTSIARHQLPNNGIARDLAVNWRVRTRNLTAAS